MGGAGQVAPTLGIDPLLTAPTYSLSEGADLAGVSSQTVSHWFRGRAGSGQVPLFQDRRRARDEEIRLSFLEVSETIVAALLRRNGASMARLRNAREFTRRYVKSEYPLATEQFKLSSRRILLEFSAAAPSARERDVLVDFDERAGQSVLPVYFSTALDRFDYQLDLAPAWARRYYPYGRQTPLVIDPQFGSGRLTVAGTNIRAESVFARVSRGYSAEEIRDDFRLPLETVRAILQFQAAA